MSKESYSKYSTIVATHVDRTFRNDANWMMPGLSMAMRDEGSDPLANGAESPMAIILAITQH